MQIDRWWRNRVEINPKEEAATSEKLNESQLAGSTHNKPWQRSTYQNNEKKRTISQSQAIQPKFVELQQNDEEDEYEEKLRTAKIYEIKKKQEIQAKKKEESQQNQIEKKEGGQQKYTFDYDGKILLARQIKYDKLQPTNQKLKPEIRETKTTADSKPLTSPLRGGNLQVQEQEIPNKNVIERKDNTKEVIGDKAIKPDKSSQFPYDNFAMNNGVRLFYESKVKDGVRHYISDSIEALTNKLSGGNLLPGEDIQKQAQQIKLTKTEYKLITDQGQAIFAQTTAKFTPQELPTKQEIGSTQEIAKSSLLQKSKVQDKQVTFDGLTQIKEPKRSESVPQNKIKLNNMKLIENLTVQNEQQLPSSKQVELVKEKDKEKEKDDKQDNDTIRNPIDKFNQQILQAKDWGKTDTRTPSLPKITSWKHISDNKVYKASLEQVYKLPRDRTNALGLKTQSDFYKNLPPSDGVIGKRLVQPSKSNGFLQTFYTTHSKFNEILRK
ncbi:hypothetical protein pb186bvf_020721 [Paramecium bursaria]